MHCIICYIVQYFVQPVKIIIVGQCELKSFDMFVGDQSVENYQV